MTKSFTLLLPLRTTPWLAPLSVHLDCQTSEMLLTMEILKARKRRIPIGSKFKMCLKLVQDNARKTPKICRNHIWILWRNTHWWTLLSIPRTNNHFMSKRPYTSAWQPLPWTPMSAPLEMTMLTFTMWFTWAQPKAKSSRSFPVGQFLDPWSNPWWAKKSKCSLTTCPWPTCAWSRIDWLWFRIMRSNPCLCTDAQLSKCKVARLVFNYAILIAHGTSLRDLAWTRPNLRNLTPANYYKTSTMESIPLAPKRPKSPPELSPISWKLASKSHPRKKSMWSWSMKLRMRTTQWSSREPVKPSTLVLPWSRPRLSQLYLAFWLAFWWDFSLPNAAQRTTNPADTIT